MKRPGASSWTTRASIATWTGCRVNGEMIPHPIVSRSVACAISAETTVDERASIWCLRHHGYASASQIVSNPCSSSARAVASISSTGSIVSCITPMRNGCAIAAILKRRDQTTSGPDGPLAVPPVDGCQKLRLCLRRVTKVAAVAARRSATRVAPMVVFQS